MTQKDFFDILPSIKSGYKIRINIKKNIKTFFEKEKTAILTYKKWDYDDINPGILELYFTEGFRFDLSQLESIEILED